jgi:hypothetical protein
MSQIGELRDGYYRILSYFREKFNDDGEYLRKNLLPILTVIHNTKNCEYYNEFVDYILELEKDNEYGDIYMDDYMKAFYFPNQSINKLCMLMDATRKYPVSNNKTYESPFINLLMKYGLYQQERINNGDDRFINFPEFLLNVINAYAIIYIYQNNIDIDAVKFFFYSKSKEEELTNYRDLNGFVDPDENLRVLNHMAISLVDEFINQYSYREIL